MTSVWLPAARLETLGLLPEVLVRGGRGMISRLYVQSLIHSPRKEEQVSL